MKVILTCGGTGGHVSPALAIAEELRRRRQNCEILFICRFGGAENAPILKAGYKAEYLNVRGIARSITPKNIKSISLAVSAERRARKIIKSFKPDVVVGTGGYVCWPVLHAANALDIPTVIHESNAVPGLVTRLLSKKSTQVMLNVKESAKHLKRQDNIITVGNPLREEFFTTSRDKARECLGITKCDVYILSYGGSGGAERINDVILSVMKSYSAKAEHVHHTHACGAKYYENYKGNISDKCKVIPYVENMPLHLAAADIVICRCGAMTLSEISAAGVAAILIPSPNVTDNHQYKNAKQLCDNGAAILVEENELNADKLTAVIRGLVENPKKRKKLSFAIKNHADSKSKEKAVNAIIKAANQSRT